MFQELNRNIEVFPIQCIKIVLIADGESTVFAYIQLNELSLYWQLANSIEHGHKAVLPAVAVSFMKGTIYAK